MSDYIRCPVCLFTMRKDASWSDDINLQCIGCERTFKLRDALGGSTNEQAPMVEEENTDGVTSKALLITLGLTVIASVLVIANDEALKGPTFLFIFGGLIVLTMFVQWVVRVNWRDNHNVSALAAMFLVGVGGARFVHCWFFLKMRDFVGLAIIVVVGVLLQFLRSSHFGGRRGDGSCGGYFGGCGGSGCGGGGCGGGGCGGCGS